MKTYIACLLFIVFAIRPAYNIGYIAYFELNINYIIETYCVNKEKPQLQCNGKCHLTEQLALDVNDSADDKPHPVTFFEAFFPVFFQEYKSDFNSITKGVSMTHNWRYNTSFYSLFMDCLDRPPQV